MSPSEVSKKLTDEFKMLDDGFMAWQLTVCGTTILFAKVMLGVCGDEGCSWSRAG